MTRTRRIVIDDNNDGTWGYLEGGGGDASNDYTPVPTYVYSGAGYYYTEMNIWGVGLISFGPVTDEQRAFMGNLSSSTDLANFPGDFVAIGFSASTYSRIGIATDNDFVSTEGGSFSVTSSGIGVGGTHSTNSQVGWRIGDRQFVAGDNISIYWGEINVISGTDGANTLISTDFPDTLRGLGGDDQLLGGGGNDYLYGGDGGDSLRAEDGDDFLSGDGGHDYLNGGAGRDELLGGDGNDHLIGGLDFDFLYGEEGNDRLEGNDGDYLYGGAGNDVLVGLGGYSGTHFDGGPGDDTLIGAGGDFADYRQAPAGVIVDLRLSTPQNTGGSGIETLSGIVHLEGSSYADTLTASNVAGSVLGWWGDDVITGGSSADLLDGGEGNDLIVGGAGNDRLYGGPGDDVFTGGAGADIMFESSFGTDNGGGNDSFIDTRAGLSGDSIINFRGGDRIVLTDATLADFTFSLSYSTLTYSGGALSFSGGIVGRLIASAAPEGGVQLTIDKVRDDFDGDGRSDILWRNIDGQFSNWLGQANGGFVENNVNAAAVVPTDWLIAGTGDFNGDGRDDILWRNIDGQMSTWLANYYGGFSDNNANSAAVVPLAWQVAGTGDFNGDGHDDILWRNSDGTVSNWLATPWGGFTANDANAASSVPISWNVVGTGDFNGDGRDDILWRNSNGQVSDWLGQANGGFTLNDDVALTQVDTAWKVVGTGDFNGDGRDDILWRNDNGMLSNWLGQANGGFVNNGGVSGIFVPLAWSVVAIGDYNGDGRDDILWRNSNGTVTDWLANANGSFTPNDAAAAQSVPTAWHVQPEAPFI